MINTHSRQRSLWTILLVAFIDNLSVGILLPLVPLLLTSHSSKISILPSHWTDAQGYILFGYLLASYTIAQFLATPLLGQLSDRYGRKPVLFLSVIGTCLAYLLFGYGVVTRQIPILFVARILDGITGGNISVAQAVIADITPNQDRTKTYGLFGGILGIGFALGPIIGSIFANPAMPFWLTAGLAAVSALLIAFVLPETFTPQVKAERFTFLYSLHSLKRVWRDSSLRRLFSGIFVWRLGFGFWTTFAAVFLIYRFGMNQSQLGLYFLIVGLWLIASQFFLVRWLARKMVVERVLYLSIFFAALTFLIYLLPHDWHQLFWIVPFLAASNALTISSVPSAVSKAAHDGNQGEFAGMSNSMQSLALSIAPILSGYISASLTPVTVIVSSTILMLVAGTIFLSYANSRKLLQEVPA